MTTTTQLKAAAEAAQQEVDWSGDAHVARYHGEYQGRYYHKGVAISFNREWTMTLCKMLAKHCPELGEPDQKDNLGFDELWSWNKTRFSDGDKPEPNPEHEWDD